MNDRVSSVDEVISPNDSAVTTAVDFHHHHTFDAMPTSLYACGSNGASQLSLNNAEDQHTLMKCQFDPNYTLPPSWDVIDLVSASTHSLLLVSTPDGNILFGAGTNTLGQLGPKCALWDEVKPVGRFKPISFVSSAGLKGDWEPVKVAVTWTTSFVVYRRRKEMEESGASASASGSGSSSMTAASKDEGEEVILACGSNDFGELGRGGNTDKIPITRPSDNPTIIDIDTEPGEHVEHIKGGQRHVVVVVGGRHGQRVLGLGASRKGELDICSGAQSSKSRGKSTYATVSPPTTIRVPIQSGEKVVDIALGASHTVALLSSGRSIGWGSDLKGQITDMRSLSNIRGIAATWGGTYTLGTDGDISFQGSSTYGQVGNRPRGDTRRAQIDVPSGTQVQKIIAGSEHLLALASTSSGSPKLLVAGWNEHGNLGVGDLENRNGLVNVPIPVKIRHAWAGLATTWVLVEEE